MTDITELAQLRAELSNPANGSKDHLRKLALLLVEALEKARQRIAELENYAEAEAVGADRAAEDGVYWMKRCKELEFTRQRIAELEEAEQKLCAANITLDARAELAERQLAEMESRTVKLPDDEDGQAYGLVKWSNGKLPATAGTMTLAYCEDAWRAAFEVFASAAGIKVEAE